MNPGYDGISLFFKLVLFADWQIHDALGVDISSLQIMQTFDWLDLRSICLNFLLGNYIKIVQLLVHFSIFDNVQLAGATIIPVSGVVEEINLHFPVRTALLKRF